MEDESRVFGSDAKNSDTFDTEETFDFFRKEETKQNIKKSATDLTDFIDSLIEDVQSPSEEDVNAGIEKILAKTHPVETPIEPKKSKKFKKVTSKVLFLVAVLSLFSVFCIYVAGSNNNISIENGFVTFAKDTIKIVFFGEEPEEYITVDVLLTDLASHGYADILFPQEFVTKSDEYKVSVPEYSDDNSGKQIAFDIHNDSSAYSFNIICLKSQQTLNYTNLNNAQTFNVNGVYIYVFENKDKTTIEFTNNGYHYYIVSDVPFNDISSLVETIK